MTISFYSDCIVFSWKLALPHQPIIALTLILMSHQLLHHFCRLFFSTLLVVLSNASILWLTFPYVRPKQFATRAFSDLSQHLLPHTSLLLSCHLFCFFLLYLFVVYYIVTQSWTVRGSKPGAHTMEARKHQVVILGAGISGDYQSLLRYLLIHTLVVGSIVSFTYPIILFDVDVCSFVYKILHYVNMAFSSCPV